MAWDNEQMFGIMAPGGPFTMLDTLLTDIENGRWWPMLRARSGPEPLIHIRMYPEAGWADPQYHPHWNALDPRLWAIDCRYRLSAIPGLLDDPNVILSFCNEPDLAGEGHPGAAGGANGDNVPSEVYREIWEWYSVVVRTWRRDLPDARCAISTPPLAAGHEPPDRPPDWEYTMPEFEALVEVCDVLNVHAYFLPDGSGATEAEDGYWRGMRCLRPPGYRETVQGLPPVGGFPDPGGLCMQYPNKPFLMSEFGNFAHDRADDVSVARTMAGYHVCYQAYSKSGRCLGVTPFLWNSGDEHKANRIRGNVPLTQALQNMTRYPACEWPYKNGGIMPEFVFAFKALADELGADVVGEPLEDQGPQNYDAFKNVVLFTTKGIMFYNERLNKAHFVAGVFPKASGPII